MDSVSKKLGEFPLLRPSGANKNGANKIPASKAKLQKAEVPKTNPPLGSDVQRLAIGWLRSNGFFCWRQNTVGIKGKDGNWRANNGFGSLNGVSDILCVQPGTGRFIAIECKGPTEKVSIEQLFFIGQLNDNGGLAFVARSLDDVKLEFKLAGILPIVKPPVKKKATS